MGLYVDGVKEHRPPISEEKTRKMLRISKLNESFDKGYIPICCKEHFLVQSDKSTPARVFRMKDKLGEELNDSSNVDEIQEIRKNLFLIE